MDPVDIELSSEDLREWSSILQRLHTTIQNSKDIGRPFVYNLLEKTIRSKSRQLNFPPIVEQLAGILQQKKDLQHIQIYQGTLRLAS